MNKYYLESLNEKTILNNRVGEKLLEYVTPYEAIQTLRRYNIGTAKDNEPAFWYTNENGEPYALQVKKEYYFGEPDVWNLQALTNEKNITKIGICESPEQAFWANLYMRHWALWVAVGRNSDLNQLINKQCFAISRNEKGEIAHRLTKIPNITFYEYEDFKEELFKTGAPTRAILPYTNKYLGSWYQKLEKFLKDEGLQKLINDFGLELV